MNREKLRSHLHFFIDAFSYDEEIRYVIKEQIECGFSHGVIEDIKYITAFVDSNPDRIDLKSFVTYEMNRDFGDPTGEMDLQWLISARDLMQSVLDEAEKESST